MYKTMLRRCLLQRRIVLVLLLMSTFVFFCSVRKSAKIEENRLSSELLQKSVAHINYTITKHNSYEIILNTDGYGNIKEDTPILVVRVEKLSKNFGSFLCSLSQIQGIEDTLIIFSHSYYDEKINNMVRRIEFARVLQIFYPYSVQTHPLVFPGQHPNDCTYSMDIKAAERTNCTGAFSPDIRGHYRNPLQTERKHHWWWTANTVFERLNCTKRYSGIVIFLENDFVFMKDFIFIALYMKRIADSLSQCEFISLGSDYFTNLVENDLYVVELTSWHAKTHSDVLAFGMSTWNTIASHYEMYCTVDDWSWSRSLLYISLNRKDGKTFKVMSSKVPRAIKMETCNSNGLFHCDVNKDLLKVEKLEKQFATGWFPAFLELYATIVLDEEADSMLDYVDNEGGWADPRDKKLCQKMTVSKIKKVLMEMKYEFRNYAMHSE